MATEPERLLGAHRPFELAGHGPPLELGRLVGGLTDLNPPVAVDHDGRRHDLAAATHPDWHGLTLTEHSDGRVGGSEVDAHVNGGTGHGFVVSWSAGPRIT